MLTARKFLFIGGTPYFTTKVAFVAEVRSFTPETHGTDKNDRGLWYVDVPSATRPAFGPGLHATTVDTGDYTH
jgi:hypothetical protein